MKTDKITEELIYSLLQSYQPGLEESMNGNNFVFDYDDGLLYYKCHKLSVCLGGSYIDSPKWIKSKNFNPKNKDGKCFQ